MSDAVAAPARSGRRQFAPFTRCTRSSLNQPPLQDCSCTQVRPVRAGRRLGAWGHDMAWFENEDPPAYVVLIRQRRESKAASQLWQRVFAVGVSGSAAAASKGRTRCSMLPIRPGIGRKLRRRARTPSRLNEFKAQELGQSRNGTRSAQYELAYRQGGFRFPSDGIVPRSPKEVLEGYGHSRARGASLANNCLLARRPDRAGVRVRATLRLGLGFSRHRPGSGHSRDALDQEVRHPWEQGRCARSSRHLKQRGLLESTCSSIWAAEFARTPFPRKGRTSKGKILGATTIPDCFTHVARQCGGLRRRLQSRRRPTQAWAWRRQGQSSTSHDLQAPSCTSSRASTTPSLTLSPMP